jgi:uncharacterized delta-60 repeat protein
MLDHAFGTDGMAAIDLGGAIGFPSQGVFSNAVATQADGKIVMAGSINQSGTTYGFVARFNVDGSLDTSFNPGGSPAGTELIGLLQNSVSPNVANGVAIQKDGKIVVAETIDEQGGQTDIAVLRLNPDGSHDGSFSGGFQIVDVFPSSIIARAIAIQADGKIVVAGAVGILGDQRFDLVRFNPDGSVDSSFESVNDGVVPPQPGLVVNAFSGAGGIDAGANSLAIGPDGTIVEAGFFATPGMFTGELFAVAAFNSDGTPDADFNADGWNIVSIGGENHDDFAQAVAIQPNGDIVVAGDSTIPRIVLGGPLSFFAMTRFLPDGELDPNFGTNSRVLTVFENSTFIDDCNAIVFQPDEKILLAGTTQSPFNGGQNFAVARYNSDGSPDTSFSFDGQTSTDLFGGERDDFGNAMALEPDGKIVVAGNTTNFLGNPIIGVARYDGDAGQLQFSSSSVTVNEGDGSTTLTVTRTGGATGTVRVDYATSDGTAIAEADYVGIAGTLTFQDGQTTQTIKATIIDDVTLEGGTEKFTVTLSNPRGGATLIGPTSATVIVKDPDIILTGPNATEGQSFSGVVATFKGSNPSVPIGDYAATISWGDAATSAGTLAPDLNGGFEVSGSHAYAEEGNYTVSVSITGADNILGSTSIKVADAPLTATRINSSVSGNKNFTGPVANFTDADPGGTVSDYSATITWDDGTTSIGSISGTGLFTVSGMHTFATFSGTHHITVAIKDAGASAASVTDNVTDPTLPNSIAAMSSQTGQWWVAESNGSGFTTTSWGAWSTGVPWVDMVSGDFTGTSRTDIAGRDLQTGNWWVGVYNGSVFTPFIWTKWSPAINWVDVKVGDFNGDGKMDIAGRVLQTGQWWVAESTGSGFVNHMWATWSTAATWVDVNVGDFNGDGMADIAGRFLQGGQWWVAQSTGTSFTNNLWTTWSTAATWVDVKVGDFNGDGQDDIVGRWLKGGQWWAAISNSSAFTNSLWATWSTGVTWLDVRVGDFNGDGQADIIGRAFQSGQWWQAQSNGSGFTSQLWGQWSTSVAWVDLQVGDFNGDGRADIAGRVQGTGQWWTGISTSTGLTTSLWANWSAGVSWIDVSAGNYA